MKTNHTNVTKWYIGNSNTHMTLRSIGYCVLKTFQQKTNDFRLLVLDNVSRVIDIKKSISVFTFASMASEGINSFAKKIAEARYVSTYQKMIVSCNQTFAVIRLDLYRIHCYGNMINKL